MQSIGSAAGFCAKHQMDKMFVGREDATEPTCLRCDADSKPKEGRTVLTEDPGEDYFKGKGSNAKITEIDGTHGGLRAIESVPSAPMLDTRHSYTMKDVVDVAVAQLRKLPMPEDIKEFKRVQKVIKTLQSLVENTNG